MILLVELLVQTVLTVLVVLALLVSCAVLTTVHAHRRHRH